MNAQSAVLEILQGGELAGSDIRESLWGLGVKMSSPAFYELMGDMEAKGLVVGFYRVSRFGVDVIKRRCYVLKKQESPK